MTAACGSGEGNDGFDEQRGPAVWRLAYVFVWQVQEDDAYRGQRKCDPGKHRYHKVRAESLDDPIETVGRPGPNASMQSISSTPYFRVSTNRVDMRLQCDSIERENAFERMRRSWPRHRARGSDRMIQGSQFLPQLNRVPPFRERRVARSIR